MNALLRVLFIKPVNAAGRLLMPAVYQTLVEVAQALQYLHNLCIVHLDLKVWTLDYEKDCGDVMTKDQWDPHA